MEPIEEKFIDDASSKSYKSLHDVSKGMLLPNIPQQNNKTVNYEMYTGNGKDKFDCPQNIQLVNKKEFVHSVLYPHHSLNFSINGNHEQDKKLSKERPNEKLINSAVEKAIQISNMKSSYIYHSAITPCVKAGDERIMLEDQIERNELIHIIETIPDIDISQLPEENFLQIVDPDYNKI